MLHNVSSRNQFYASASVRCMLLNTTISTFRGKWNLRDPVAVTWLTGGEYLTSCPGGFHECFSKTPTCHLHRRCHRGWPSRRGRPCGMWWSFASSPECQAAGQKGWNAPCNQQPYMYSSMAATLPLIHTSSHHQRIRALFLSSSHTGASSSCQLAFLYGSTP